MSDEPITDANALAPDRESMTFNERHWHFKAVSRAYFADQVTVETFLAARDKYGPDWRAICRDIAAARIKEREPKIDMLAVSNHLHKTARASRPWWRRWLL